MAEAPDLSCDICHQSFPSRDAQLSSFHGRSG
jgi:hypothetical protein